MIGSFASLGTLRWFAMPGGQTFIVGGMVIAGVFAAGYWLRWDARADATRTVITRVVEKHKKENDKLLTALRIALPFVSNSDFFSCQATEMGFVLTDAL